MTIQPLTPDETAALVGCFTRNHTKTVDPTLSMFQGLVAAIATIPQDVLPQQWLPGIVGAFAEKGDDLQPILDLLAREYNVVLHAIEHASAAWSPAYLWYDGETAEEFARGFLLGMMMFDHHRWVAVTTRIPEVLRPLAILDRSTSAGDALRDRAAAVLLTAVRAAYDLWAPYRDEWRRQNEESVPSSTVNRGLNVPCPCGSGKKYKRCHGKVVASV